MFEKSTGEFFLPLHVIAGNSCTLIFNYTFRFKYSFILLRKLTDEMDRFTLLRDQKNRLRKYSFEWKGIFLVKYANYFSFGSARIFS